MSPALGMMSDQERARFDRLVSLVSSRGTGITLKEIGAAGALARELEAEQPSPKRVEALAGRLGLPPDEVRGAAS